MPSPEPEALQSDLVSRGLQGLLDFRDQQLAEAARPTSLLRAPDGSIDFAASALDLGNLERAQQLALSFGPGVIKGWHGTPHTFEPVEGNPFGAFRDEAIGSGEGAQAYGYGHYIAGNRSVAEGYQRNLSRDNQGYPTFKGLNAWDLLGADSANIQLNRDVSSGLDTDPYIANQALREFSVDADIDAAINRLNTRANTFDDPFTRQMGRLKQEATDAREAASWLQTNREHIAYKEPDPGHLLEVQILPEEAELLDWDKRLAEQSPGVQEKLSSLLKINPEILQNPDRDPSGYGQATGAGIYQDLAADLSPGIRGRSYSEDAQQASAALHQAGIPGIKYLDAGSRGKQPFVVQSNFENVPPEQSWWSDLSFHNTREEAEQAAVARKAADEGIVKNSIYRVQERPLTSNYVIFHPSNLRITARDGTPLTPVDHDPFAGQGQ